MANYREMYLHLFREITDVIDKLTLEALTMAVRRENPVKGLLHHTDRGVQYASGEYQVELKRLGFYNSVRPHSGLGWISPNQFSKLLKLNQLFLDF